MYSREYYFPWNVNKLSCKLSKKLVKYFLKLNNHYRTSNVFSASLKAGGTRILKNILLGKHWIKEYSDYGDHYNALLILLKLVLFSFEIITDILYFCSANALYCPSPFKGLCWYRCSLPRHPGLFEVPDISDILFLKFYSFSFIPVTSLFSLL